MGKQLTMTARLQDFSTVDALAAEHYATKLPQPAACAVSLPSAPNQAITRKANQWQSRSIFATARSGHTDLQHQLAGPPHQDVHSLQHKARTQASMQQYLAPQPTTYIPYQEANASTYPTCKQPTSQQHSFASGVLTDECIDLVSQSEIMPVAIDFQSCAGAHVPQTAPVQLAAKSRTDACGDLLGTEHDAAANKNGPSIEENAPLEELMTCSTNLLNSGIRVHKYSNAPFAIVVLPSPQSIFPQA